MKIDETEQWILDGKCHICRRKNYCGTPCTKNKSKAEEKEVVIYRPNYSSVLNPIDKVPNNTST